MAHLSKYRTSLLAPRSAHVHSFAETRDVKFRVETKRPPNFEKIEKVFPNAANPGVLFTHDHVIYNPSGIARIGYQLLAHECTHMLQQDAMGVEHWWEFYLDQKQFRFDQELDAYCVEYEAWCWDKTHNRASRKQYCRSCAERLAGPLYNHMLRRRDAQDMIDLNQRGHAEDKEAA